MIEVDVRPESNQKRTGRRESGTIQGKEGSNE